MRGGTRTRQAPSCCARARQRARPSQSQAAPTSPPRPPACARRRRVTHSEYRVKSTWGHMCNQTHAHTSQLTNCSSQQHHRHARTPPQHHACTHTPQQQRTRVRDPRGRTRHVPPLFSAAAARTSTRSRYRATCVRPPLTSSPPSVPGATHIIRNVVHRGRERNLAVPYLSACRIFSACFAGEQHRKQQQAHAHAQPQATAHAHTTTTKTRAHTHLCHGVPVRSPLKPVQRAVAVRINVRKQGIARARTETRCGDLRRQRCCCARRRQRRRTRADAPA